MRLHDQGHETFFPTLFSSAGVENDDEFEPSAIPATAPPGQAEQYEQYYQQQQLYQQQHAAWAASHAAYQHYGQQQQQQQQAYEMQQSQDAAAAAAYYSYYGAPLPQSRISCCAGFCHSFL